MHIKKKIITGQKTIAAAGTAEVAIPRSFQTDRIIIKPLNGNSGIIFVGGSGVDSTTGLELRPNKSEQLVLDINLMKEKEDIWIDSSISGEGVSFLVILMDPHS